MELSRQENPAKKSRVSRADWLNAALDVLREGGIEAVRVERLAARLGVAKSGFYYHFGNRKFLNAALLDHWRNAEGVPQQRQRKATESTASLLKAIVDTVQQYRLGELDFAIRQWAKQDPKVSDAYRRDIKKRIAFVRDIFAEHGIEGDELEMRTMTFVGYTSTEVQLFTNLSVSKHARLWKRRIAMLLRKD